DRSGLENEHMSGFAPIAAKAALKRGFCAEADLPSSFWSWRAANGTVTPMPLRDAIEQFHQQRDNPAKFGTGRFLFPRISDAAYAKLVAKTKRAKLMNELVDQACGEIDKKSYPKPQLNYHVNADGDATFGKIDDSLNRGRIALIEYFASVLEDLDG